MKTVSSITYTPCSRCKNKMVQLKTYILRVNKVQEKQNMKPMKTSKVMMEINIKVTILTQFYIKAKSFEKNFTSSGCDITEMSTVVLLICGE